MNYVTREQLLSAMNINLSNLTAKSITVLAAGRKGHWSFSPDPNNRKQNGEIGLNLTTRLLRANDSKGEQG